MNRILKILMVFLLSVPLLISPAAAWTGPTHQNIVSKIYYSLPVSVQHHLDLNEMKRGSIAPDLVFQDSIPYHNYPAAVGKAQSWLNKGKAAYKAKNYKYASYCFGVASHYIVDPFSAPHCVTKEGSNHLVYEKQAENMNPSIRYVSGTVSSLLKNAYKNGQYDWKIWIKNKSSSVTRKDLNNAASAAYSLIRKCV